MRETSSSWMASVRNNASGGISLPGGIHFFSIAATEGSYGRVAYRPPCHDPAGPARPALGPAGAWELRDGSAPTFRELQARCENVSSSVLNDRLRELRDAGIVAGKPGAGYRLTTEGHDLLSALAPIDAWAQRWATRTQRR